ncbi:uncharacterized SAM-binding protein YcdF (DUF218 family) [Natronospira proteinivora]|uniref:Uncharacterized SAM-binding protein YcdF (DUF218 family) n=1 Tax=Natronospira proteinivora TaxID=1807133 RepID=A0ABT1G9D3_9GAMM|nr:ElyC/SanA/YdcF family protein [Natronospira proteinivora]MCP1727922.1 uncharacterized SAM-binding protein YcdF (DUF218 family) [Natronospira proteinivora]
MAAVEYAYLNPNTATLMTLNHILGAIITLLSPLPLVMLLAMAGLVLLVLGRRRLGGGLVLSGVLLLGLFSNEPVARLLLSPLEDRYPPLENLAELEGVHSVVVLGSYASDIASRPATTRLSGVASLRLMEGIRIHKALPDSELVLTGGTVFAGSPSATVMSRAALSLGVNPLRLRTFPGPENTREEARILSESLGDAPFVLVTSASHMPRAMALCEKLGLNPIPAPTVWRASSRSDPRRFAPSSAALAMTERAIHEYLGLAWSKLQGDID